MNYIKNCTLLTIIMISSYIQGSYNASFLDPRTKLFIIKHPVVIDDNFKYSNDDGSYICYPNRMNSISCAHTLELDKELQYQFILTNKKKKFDYAQQLLHARLIYKNNPEEACKNQLYHRIGKTFDSYKENGYTQF